MGYSTERQVERFSFYEKLYPIEYNCHTKWENGRIRFLFIFLDLMWKPHSRVTNTPKNKIRNPLFEFDIIQLLNNSQFRRHLNRSIPSNRCYKFNVIAPRPKTPRIRPPSRSAASHTQQPETRNTTHTTMSPPSAIERATPKMQSKTLNSHSYFWSDTQRTHMTSHSIFPPPSPH